MSSVSGNIAVAPKRIMAKTARRAKPFKKPVQPKRQKK